MNHTFARFLLVGVVNTIIGLSVMVGLFHFLDLSYWVATFVGNVVGACTSFTLNRNFTFKSDNSIYKSIPRFVIVVSFCYFISYSFGLHIIASIIEHIHMFPKVVIEYLAILVGTGCYTILNYLGQKQFVFSK